MKHRVHRPKRRCFATVSATPVTVGNSGLPAVPACSFIQPLRTAIASCRRGVLRSFLPLPWHLTQAPRPKTTSSKRKLTSSENRKPVCTCGQTTNRKRAEPASVAGTEGKTKQSNAEENNREREQVGLVDEKSQPHCPKHASVRRPTCWACNLWKQRHP